MVPEFSSTWCSLRIAALAEYRVTWYLCGAHIWSDDRGKYIFVVWLLFDANSEPLLLACFSAMAEIGTNGEGTIVYKRIVHVICLIVFLDISSLPPFARILLLHDEFSNAATVEFNLDISIFRF